MKKQHTDLTPQMISSGSWKDITFKPYNLEALGIPITRGHLHPLLKVRSQIRQIYLEMGYVLDLTLHYIKLFLLCELVCAY